MPITFSNGTLLVPRVSSSNFNETALDASLVPITTSGSDFTNIGVSGTDVFSAVEDMAITINTPNLVQVEFTAGTDLITTNNLLNLNTGSVLSNGSGFTVDSNNVTLVNIGIYKINWQVTGEITGSTFATRSRNLVTDLNRNSGTFVAATQTAGVATSVRTAPVGTSEGCYIISTNSINETVGIRSRDLSTDSSANITFTLLSGYLRIERLKRL
jgi:hypothetical protein